MMIEVKRHVPPPGLEYSTPSYPGKGIYITSVGVVMVTDVVTWICHEADITGMATSGHPTSGGYVTEAGLIQLLAVLQKPELAKDLTGEVSHP